LWIECPGVGDADRDDRLGDPGGRTGRTGERTGGPGMGLLEPVGSQVTSVSGSLAPWVPVLGSLEINAPSPPPELWTQRGGEVSSSSLSCEHSK